MTKPGHEMPLNDNTNPADLTSRADGPQIRIGDPEPRRIVIPVSDVAAEVMTPDQQESVERYVESDTVSSQEALQRRIPRAQANRLIGAQEARRMADSLAKTAEARKETEKTPTTSIDESVQLIKSTYPEEQPPQGT